MGAVYAIEVRGDSFSLSKGWGTQGADQRLFGFDASAAHPELERRYVVVQGNQAYDPLVLWNRRQESLTLPQVPLSPNAQDAARMLRRLCAIDSVIAMAAPQELLQGVDTCLWGDYEGQGRASRTRVKVLPGTLASQIYPLLTGSVPAELPADHVGEDVFRIPNAVLWSPERWELAGPVDYGLLACVHQHPYT
jgi:hypothetical protein